MAYWIVIVLFIMASIGLAKLYSLFRNPIKEFSQVIDFIFSAYLSITAYKRHIPRYPVLNHFLFSLVGFVGSYFWVGSLARSIESDLALAYLTTAPLYFLIEFLNDFSVLVINKGRLLREKQSRTPFFCGSLSEFWGRSWNPSVSQWLREQFHLRSSRKVMGLGAAFVFSGLWHEFIFTIPHYLFFQVNTFGAMMIFFSLQFVGVVFEKRFLQTTPLFVRRAFMYLVVIGPVPLFIDPYMLHFFNYR